MNVAELTAQLDGAFRLDVVLQHPYGGVFAGEEPIDLEEAVRAACEDEDEYDDYVSDGFESLDGLQELLSLDWEGCGPGLTSVASLELLDLEQQKHYVVFRDEASGLRAFGLVAGPLSMFLPAFVETFFATNGTAYGATVISSIPTGTLNSRPDLIPQASVRQGYRGFLDWATAHHFSGWDNLDPIGWSEPLSDDEQDDFDNRMAEASPEQENQILLDEYFKRCYDEPC
jgi:hypothetical protein